MVPDHRGEYASLSAAIELIAPKIGCVPQTLHEWVHKLEVDTALRDGVASEERDRIKALQRELKERHRANENLKLASAFFCPGGTRPPNQVLKDFVDQHRETRGGESTCNPLQIVPSWFNHHRLLEQIGYIPPAEAEANYYRQLAEKTETPVSL